MNSHSPTDFVRAKFPILYWLTFIYLIGIPSFILFDPSGRTHLNGLFNATSISRIVHVLMTAYLFAVLFGLERKPIIHRKTGVPKLPWLLLLGLNTLSVFFQEPSRLTPTLATDLPLCLFRLGEWALAFMLILALYSRVPAEDGLRLVVDLVGHVSWAIIAMVWIMVPIAPKLAFGLTDESGSTRILGGQFYNPGDLALHAGCAFFFTAFFARRFPIRWLGCLVCLITIGMTRARTQLLGFIVALVCYLLVYYRRPAIRALAAASLVVAGITAWPFSETVISYLARGQKVSNIESLDDRTFVWKACWDGIQAHPFLGSGFLIGARNAIRDHWTFSHWVPPHAHNDLIQATLESGVFAGIIVIYIYAFLLRRCLKNAREGAHDLLLLLVLVQLFVTSITGLVIAFQYAGLGALLLLCWIGSTGPLRKSERLAVPATIPPRWLSSDQLQLAAVSRRLVLNIDDFRHTRTE